MISQLAFIESTQANPYKNLAMEKILLDNVEKEQCILFLWQNNKTVVIGKNQNCFSQCNIDAIENNGGHIARRTSGGGAVYHDLGNINFSFIVSKENYNIEKQLNVIITALGKLRINALKTGRNDISVSGKKVSGNAFIVTDNACCHHGTIMVNVNIEVLSQYLYVSREKLEDKGVASVRARVGNLCDFRPNITIQNVKNVLFEAFGEVYGLTPKTLSTNFFDKTELKNAEDMFASKEWIFDRDLNANFNITKRFSWGEVTLAFVLDKNLITDCQVYTDALNTEIFPDIGKSLVGLKLSSATVSDAILEQIKTIKEDTFDAGMVNTITMLTDIYEYIKPLDF